MARKFDREGMFYKNRFTFTSLIIILAMYFIAQSYYNPESVIRSTSSIVTGNNYIGGDFELTAHDGSTFTQENLKDKYTLIFFGYTHCPDICPTALSTAADVKSRLNERQQANLQVAFVTVDPKRDTQAVLKDYVPDFDPTFIGLTGTLQQVRDITKAYSVYYKHREADEGAYLVDHSSFLYLMGPDGRYTKHYKHSDKPADIAESLKQYLHM